MKKILLLLVSLMLLSSSVALAKCSKSYVYPRTYWDGMSYFTDSVCQEEGTSGNLYKFTSLSTSKKIMFLYERMENMMNRIYASTASISTLAENVSKKEDNPAYIEKSACDLMKETFGSAKEISHCNKGGTYWLKDDYPTETIEGMIACLKNKHVEECHKKYDINTTCSYTSSEKYLLNKLDAYRVQYQEARENCEAGD